MPVWKKKTERRKGFKDRTFIGRFQMTSCSDLLFFTCGSHLHFFPCFMAFSPLRSLFFSYTISVNKIQSQNPAQICQTSGFNHHYIHTQTSLWWAINTATPFIIIVEKALTQSSAFEQRSRGAHCLRGGKRPVVRESALPLPPAVPHGSCCTLGIAAQLFHLHTKNPETFAVTLTLKTAVQYFQLDASTYDDPPSW